MACERAIGLKTFFSNTPAQINGCVIPAKAGIQYVRMHKDAFSLDSRHRGNDKLLNQIIRRNILIIAVLVLSIFSLTPNKSSGSNSFLPPDSLLLSYAHSGAMAEYESTRDIVGIIRNGTPAIKWAANWADLLDAALLLAEETDLGSSPQPMNYQDIRDRCLITFNARLSEATGSEDSAAALFAIGTMEGFEATRLEQNRKHIRAMKYAIKSARHLKQAYILDTSLVDAILGFALYDYWSSKALLAITWTPLKADLRRESIEKIREVMTDGNYARYLSGAYLSWILIGEKRYLEAAAVADSLLENVGEARIFLEPSGKAYFMAEEWEEARDRYERLALSIRQAVRHNPVAEIGALHRLGQISFEQQDWKAVIHYTETANSIKLNEKQKKRKKDDLKRLGKLRRKAEKNLR